MTATRFPRIAEFREGVLVGPIVADVLDALGIEDADLPDLFPDDLDYDDHDAVARCFPALLAKFDGLKP